MDATNRFFLTVVRTSLITVDVMEPGGTFLALDSKTMVNLCDMCTLRIHLDSG